jgi:hypothetical protein
LELLWIEKMAFHKELLHPGLKACLAVVL